MNKVSYYVILFIVLLLAETLKQGSIIETQRSRSLRSRERHWSPWVIINHLDTTLIFDHLMHNFYFVRLY